MTNGRARRGTTSVSASTTAIAAVTCPLGKLLCPATAPPLVNAGRPTRGQPGRQRDPARPPVELRLRDNGTTVTLEVTDHGPGINPAVLPHVFDRFAKADTARARSEGSGLGLSIARENAQLHGGTIEASNSGSSARFVLTLPHIRPIR
jgi:signal transduction histidine kinase